MALHRAARKSHRHALFGTLAVAATVLATLTTASPTMVAGTPAAVTLPVCHGWYEDGSPRWAIDLEPDDVVSGLPCWWDATTLGNRQGSSFIMWHAS